MSKPVLFKEADGVEEKYETVKQANRNKRKAREDGGWGVLRS